MSKKSLNIIQLTASNVYTKRIEKGFTQEKLAELSNLSDSFVSKLERVKFDNISIVKIQNFSNVLECSISELISELISEEVDYRGLDKSAIKLIHGVSIRNDQEINNLFLALLEKMT